MAFNKTLAHRLFNLTKTWNPTLTNCHISSSSSAVGPLISPTPAKAAPDPGDDYTSRRFLQSAATSLELRSLPRGEKLWEKLRSMDVGKDRIRLDGLTPPPAAITADEVRKLLRVSQLEVVKSELRQIPEDNILFEDFVQICSGSCGNTELGLEFAKRLDESGTVIVLGNVVLLRPYQVVKAIQDLILVPVPIPNSPTWKELEAMEAQKADIDKRAESLVRWELWGGLGYLVLQTAAFMRLTFWELSWDVMEPICFYVTSIYFMAGYAFFLRTSKEPSFEGFFQSRFGAKQKQLMKIQNFDLGRYNELRRACYPHSSSSVHESSLFASSFDNCGRTETSALH